MRGIKELQKWNIVKKIKEKDEKTKRQLNNIYVLIDKSEWVPKPETRVAVGNTESDQAACAAATRENESRVAGNSQSRVAPLNCKETQNMLRRAQALISTQNFRKCKKTNAGMSKSSFFIGKPRV